jgi:iron-sulfur cluster assembly accessory protein
MLQQVENQVVSLSPAAVTAVRDILTQRQLEGYALRVYVAGSGCSGAQFGMALDNNIRNTDLTFESDGVQLVVDDVSIDYLRGAKIDFVHDDERGAGFLVDSPSAMHAHEGESCACGGSCSCNQ